VPYPPYWSLGKGSGSSSADNSGSSPGDFCELFEVSENILEHLQKLVNATYSDVTTRDRQRHSGSWEVPSNFQVQSAQRNENSKLWRKYSVRKAELQHDYNPESAEDYKVYDDVKTTALWESFEGERLDASINEWYLFHGTSASAAVNICSTDFKMRLAGSATGTLYGRGSYFAESVTKADEYAKEEDGFYTILLCRVLGGNVRYCDERSPDPEKLEADCVEGPCDCILGDRIKTSGTYREFILFDTENVYPEYIMKITRGEMFKSRSHP
ncbi:unnamed protein product, partial [Polarella glacialis]